MGLPYVVRSDICARRPLFHGIVERRFLFAAAFSLGLRTPGSASTSAHSRLPLANLRNAPGTDPHPPNRFSSVRGSYFPASRYPRREGTARFLRTVSPQSLSSSLA